MRRGSVSLFLRVSFLRPQDAIRLHPEVIEGVARALEPLRQKGLIEGGLSADAVASIPGALEPTTDEGLRPADWRVVKEALARALDGLDEMRVREATHLVKDLGAIVRRMKKTLATVRRRAPAVVVEQQARIRERVDTLLADRGISIDDATLAREIALLADRSDVNEEITRIDAHLAEVGRYLGQEGEVGRTLEFLSQEILRETNTIGSKSADVEVARAVISLKSDVDRLKEQVANLE